jgi:cell fate (sporulation/competence/biofilm development) regulator YlbF (YheA/YmcA/DUF963 family)
MDNIDFQNEELAFLADLKNSSLYQETIKLDKEIQNDESLSALAHKRDLLYQQANDCEGQDKENLLIKAKDLNDQLLANEKMKRYLENYQKIKKILNLINDELSKGLHN